MKLKNFCVLGLVLIGIFALSGIASALTIKSVKFDGDELMLGDNYIEKNDEYEVKVVIQTGNNEAYDDAQVSVYLKGTKYGDNVEDTTEPFKIENATQYVKKLKLKLPIRMEQKEYTLFVRIENSDREIAEELNYSLKVRSLKNAVYIRDIILSPNEGIKAGRALLATVRVQNRGRTDEEDVKVTFSVPDLGISASDYIDELPAEGKSKDSKSSEDLYLRIPQCVEEGVYEGVVEVEYDDGDEVTSEKVSLKIFEDESCEVKGEEEEEPSVIAGADKIIVSIGPESQDITKGAGGVFYPVTITNAGKSSETYIINVKSGEWGSFIVKPINVVTVGKDETKSVYIHATANDAAPVGSQIFTVEIKSGEKVIDEVTLKANVIEAAAKTGGIGIDLKRTLEIGLIVLVVVLVILALVIGFSKLKGEEGEKEEGESYY